MMLGDCQVTKGIGTAPAHNPNQDYNVIDDEPEVFCEDEQKKMPVSECRQCGELWYSIAFISGFIDNFEIAISTLEEIGIQQDRFLRGDSWEVHRLFRDLQESLFELRNQFRVVTL